jgi:hypothetical protein
MVRTCFKNESRENSKEHFEHKNEGKHPKQRLRSRLEQQVRKDFTQSKERS